MIGRLLILFPMWCRAWRLKVPFFRRATFRPPSSILIDGRLIPLSFPAEEGVKWDFIGIFLEDIYGLAPMDSERVKTVLDIGGNTGFFSLAARNHFPAARIHMYEPNAALKRYAASQSDHARFDFFPEAVGGHAGNIRLEFPAGNDSNLGRSLETPDGATRMISLDDAVKRLGGEVDLLKLDCEGAEWDMFREARCWPLIRRVVMEYHLFAGQTHQEARETMQSLGYIIQHHSFDPGAHCGLLHAQHA